MYQNMRPTRGYQTFVQELKAGKFHNVFLFTGEEGYLVNWAGEMLVKRFVHPGATAIDLTILDGQQSSVSEILQSARTLPMLSEKRVIWVKDFTPLRQAKGISDKDATELIEYIKDPNPSALLIFSSDEINGRGKVVKALKKDGSFYSFDQLNERELMSFANKRFQAAGLKISRADMVDLIHRTGYFNKESTYRLFQFLNDVQKIIAHAEGEWITAMDLDAAVHGEGDTFIFNLLDGISGNDKKVAFTILHNKLKNNSNEAGSIVGAITSQVELLLIIREFMDSRQGHVTPSYISKYTGMNEYRIKKAMNYARRYPLKKLQDMLIDIYETNWKIVSGLLDGRTALELFIARI